MGAGDGGWGAFYDISALYPLRTLLFGYSSNLQMVQGTFADGQFTPGPELALPVLDSLDQPLCAPAYLGLQSLPESLFYRPCPSTALPQSESQSPSQSYSLYQATREMEHVNLFTRCPVTGIHRQDDGSIRLHSSLSPKGKLSAQNARVYDAVICTESTWALQMGSAITGFDYAHLPAETTLSLQESHWITSCKVFYPLKQRYWEAPNPNGPGFDPIPQCISTDTFIQDAYGVAADVGDTRDPGALLVSYTWEDDCAKLEADEDEAAFARRCLGELDRVLLNSSNIKTTISQYVNESFPVVIRWERQPRYRGCAKLYRERSWMLDYALLRYNQDFSAASGLYFAGEGYSVEGGWTEPALRGALDAVIHLNHNHGATFMEGFSMDLYPRYSAWNPAP
jgi:tryptophan 2-monooxygenase